MKQRIFAREWKWHADVRDFVICLMANNPRQSNPHASTGQIASKWLINGSLKHLLSHSLRYANRVTCFVPQWFPLSRNDVKRVAFTLAEVLITLGIIGIVAAMTIPTLINDYQKQVEVSQLKKFYSATAQALQQLAADYGCTGDMVCTGLFNSGTGFSYGAKSVILLKELSTYMKIDKICGVASSGAPQREADSGCFGYNLSQRTYKDLNGNIATSTGSTPDFYELQTVDRIWATLSDGTFFGILDSQACNTSGHCGHLYVDVNGAKPPNQLGRDVFYFNIDSNAILSPGAGQFSACATEPCNISNIGRSCSCRLMKNSWVMDY